MIGPFITADIWKYRHWGCTWILTFLCFAVLESSLAAQHKIEVEKRIDVSVFPDTSLHYLAANFPLARKIRYYQEWSADTSTYEAKFRIARERYSVEFWYDGSLMDVERKINFKMLDEDMADVIAQRWVADFSKWKVIKCQEQTSDTGLRYEIEVRGKGASGTALYEYLFEADGTFVRRALIVLPANDMTLY